jgi:hypothetical protein
VTGAVMVVAVTIVSAAVGDAETTAGVYSLAVLALATPLVAAAFARAREK